MSETRLNRQQILDLMGGFRPACVIGAVLLCGVLAAANGRATEPNDTQNAKPSAAKADAPRESRVGELIAQLKDHQDAARSARAAEALGKLRPAEQRAINALVEALADERDLGETPAYVPAPHRLVADAAVEALLEIGRPAVPALARALHKDSEDVRRRAAEILGKLGPSAAAADLRQLLAREKSEDVRYSAAEAYAAVETDPKQVVAAMLPLLRDRSPHVRGCAARLLGKLGPKAAAAVPALLRALDDRGLRSQCMGPPDMYGERAVRFDVAESLGLIGAAARAALPKLTAMMATDADREVRVSAALAVCRIDPPNKPAFAQLVRLLDDGRGGVQQAALALGQLGPAARAAVPALGRALLHQYVYVRANAAEALGRIGGSEVVPLLVFAMRDPDAMVRYDAAESLGKLGAEAAPAVPDLIKILRGNDAHIFPVRLAAAAALGAIGPAAAGATEALKRASRDKDDRLREAAAEALKKVRAGPVGTQARVTKNDASKPPAEAAAIDRIERRGARVTIDPNRPGKPAVAVEFWEEMASDDDLAPLEDLPQLERVSLAKTGVTDEGLAHLAALRQLQSLSLADDHEITDEGLAHLKGSTQLRSLDLSRTRVNGEGFKSLEGMSRLRRLKLDQTRVTDIGLKHLRGLTNLQTLDLTMTHVTDAGLAYVGEMRGLESLNLFATSITDAGLAHLTGLTRLKNLTLRTGEITEAGVKALRQALPGTTIDDDFSGDAPDPDESETVYEVQNLGGKVTHAENRAGKPVIAIDFSGMGIIDEDLATAAKLHGLESLDLSDTDITDAGLAHLAGLTALRTLNLSHSQVTDQGVRKLQQTLPKCKIKR
jgi:HEAT repeat protein